ncbi:cardiolipin synthase [Rathayibacter sp. VKM Ac-2801]|uniref:cardiolipin synthase n=1 Tax=Rathayibacter sp. VKM Ac-2801 TaxID=2609255 RepID=UPI00131F504F|nr:cardiolipin synthase [Rathayibacter sp. VKM Ac-2801]QHC69458.1 cardiolipin synthase [Rathayibacter sp. VKM Ac-2801]
MPAPDWGVILPIAAVVVELVVRVIAVIVVPRNRRPTTGLAWLMAIFLIPYVGILLFLFIGSYRLPRKRRRKQQEINRFILESTDGIDRVAREHPWPQWLESVVTLNRNLGAMPLVGGNDARLQGDYEQTIRAMAAEIDRARRYVHCEFYILAADSTTAPFFDALDRAVARGVRVRILLDHIASIRVPGYYSGTHRRLRALERAGATWSYMLPVRPWRGQYQRPDLRNHRKLLIVDGNAAFMGSQNVVDSSYNKRGNIRRGLHWHDLMVRLEGPVVQGINAIFITDWYSETDELLLRESEPMEALQQRDTIDCQVVPSGPGFEGENNLRLFLTLLYSAQKSIIITSPYFVPDEAMLYAITTATRRGVHVELFVSEIGDQAVVYHAQRSYYETLLTAGVRIWMYRKPTILHAKHFTIDDDVAVIGSSNMDMRSFTLNLEVSLMVRGSEFVEDLRQVQQDYREHSRELTLREWRQQPLRSTLLDNLARLTSALQ